MPRPTATFDKLVRDTAQRIGMSERKTRPLLQAYHEVIIAHLSQQTDRVRLPGIGTLLVVWRATRKCRRPDGKECSSPARWTLRYRPSVTLRKQVAARGLKRLAHGLKPKRFGGPR
jgi:nucleoid DNA-binding protein